MREILFRGKSIYTGEWVEGFLVIATDAFNSTEKICFIFRTNVAYHCFGGFDGIERVDPETVGQFTGLTDKNGKKIFEGDVVNCYGDMRTVVYDDEYAEFEFDKHDNVENTDSLELCCDCDECEIVGNKYDYYEV